MYELKIYRGVMCYDIQEWSKNSKRNWLVVSKMTWGIWRNLTQAPKSLNNFHFNGLFLIKVYNAWAKKVQRSYVCRHWRLMQNLKENWPVLSKMTWGIWKIFTGWKKSDFILESKMAELYQNKNSKQPDQPDPVWKLYFNLEINK